MLSRSVVRIQRIRQFPKHGRLYASSQSNFDFEKLTQNLLRPDSSVDLRQNSASAIRNSSLSNSQDNSQNAGWLPLGDLEEDPESAPSSFEASTSGGQKEELIFKEVLGQVLSNNRRPSRNQATTQPLKRSTPLSDSILALFDKPYKPTGHDVAKSSSPTSSTKIGSLLDGLLTNSQGPVLTSSELAQREAAQRLVAPIMHHIQSLSSNTDITQYYEEVIVPRFNPSQVVNPEEHLELDVIDPKIGRGTISLILEKCISALANDFNDPLGAIHLFEISKHHSIDFFTESCSAGVYNHIIRIRWDCYRDIYAVVSLASEIAINAIQPTLETTELLSKIYRDAIDSSNGMSSSALGMPLWTGQDLKRLDELNRYRTRFQSLWAAKPILNI